MANQLYPSAKQGFLQGAVDLSTDTIKVTLIDGTAYAFSSAHRALSDIPVGARVATADLSGISTHNGVFDASDVTFGAVMGNTVTAVIIWVDTGLEETSDLLAYFDTGLGGLPVTPSGGDITLAWAPGGVFAL